MHASVKKTTVFVAAAIGLMAGASIGFAQNAPAAKDAVAPEQSGELKYTPSSRSGSVSLSGWPGRAGAYKLRVTIPPNTTDGPHTHSDTRQITVISGSWYFGQGDTLDRASATRMPAGTTFVEPANSMHYNFTTTEAAVVHISGTGPSRSVYKK